MGKPHLKRLSRLPAHRVWLTTSHQGPVLRVAAAGGRCGPREARGGSWSKTRARERLGRARELGRTATVLKRDGRLPVCVAGRCHAMSCRKSWPKSKNELSFACAALRPPAGSVQVAPGTWFGVIAQKLNLEEQPGTQVAGARRPSGAGDRGGRCRPRPTPLGGRSGEGQARGEPRPAEGPMWTKTGRRPDLGCCRQRSGTSTRLRTDLGDAGGTGDGGRCGRLQTPPPRSAAVGVLGSSFLPREGELPQRGSSRRSATPPVAALREPHSVGDG